MARREKTTSCQNPSIDIIQYLDTLHTQTIILTLVRYLHRWFREWIQCIQTSPYHCQWINLRPKPDRNFLHGRFRLSSMSLRSQWSPIGSYEGPPRPLYICQCRSHGEMKDLPLLRGSSGFLLSISSCCIPIQVHSRFQKKILQSDHHWWEVQNLCIDQRDQPVYWRI